MGDVVSGFANIFTGADDTAAAGQLAAAQQAQAAKDAAIAAAFRPVGMTTRFGSANFVRSIDPKTGIPYVSEAGYTAAPELAALQERLFGQFGAGLTQAEEMQRQAGMLGSQAERLYSLGAGYLAESPDVARQRYMSQQQALLAPQQEQALANLRNNLFQSGRAGLASTGGTNPETAAYYNALANQQLQLAAGAEQAAQQQQMFGAGLLGTGTQLQQSQQATMAGAYSPLQSLLGLSGNVENLSQMPYQLGIQLGQSQQPGQTAGAQMYQQGLSQAAQTAFNATQAANQANAGFWGGLISGAAQGAGAYYGAQAAAAGSDFRLKENIKHEGVLPSGLNIYSYEYKPEYKDRPNTGYGRFIGVMAQEAEKIIPEAVSFDKDGFRQVDYSLIH